ncbi:MAG TPA: response regulator transcription factor [Iamia sp.]|nr:response regulator transcription factor [Iamia sp.]
MTRVLLIDDEPNMITGIGRALRAEGHLVDAATDGAVGLELALSGEYDVIVLDVMLPGMNGHKVCRTARDAGLRTPILMLSAKDGEWDVADGLDVGADDYLTKPFSVVELLARVRACARRAATSVHVNGDLRFDPDLRRCWRGSTEVKLTGREAKLLAALFQEVGGVVSKEELIARAWGPHFTGDINVVEVYVGRLRRKVDTPFGEDDIETVRGAGYRLRPRRPRVAS